MTTKTVTRDSLHAQVTRTLRSYGRGTPNLYDVDAAVDEIARDFGLIDIEGWHPITGDALITDEEFWTVMRKHSKRPVR